MGYTKRVVTGVWAGNNDNTPMERKGGSILAAVPIWSAFMKEALPLQQPEAFNPPVGQSVHKPMLNGNYLAYYQYGGQTYPQIHDILYYVDKKDPTGPLPSNPAKDSQFANWESGVLAWATSTNPAIQLGVTHNQPIPFGAMLVEPEDATAGTGSQFGQTIGTRITLKSPKSGSLVPSGEVQIDATINSDKEIIKIEVFYNDALVDTRNGSFGREFHYVAGLSTGGSDKPQNTLLIRATDIGGATAEKDAIFFR
jgi:hypothetical protein